MLKNHKNIFANPSLFKFWHVTLDFQNWYETILSFRDSCFYFIHFDFFNILESTGTNVKLIKLLLSCWDASEIVFIHQASFSFHYQKFKRQGSYKNLYGYRCYFSNPPAKQNHPQQFPQSFKRRIPGNVFFYTCAFTKEFVIRGLFLKILGFLVYSGLFLEEWFLQNNETSEWKFPLWNLPANENSKGK